MMNASNEAAEALAAKLEHEAVHTGYKPTKPWGLMMEAAAMIRAQAARLKNTEADFSALQRAIVGDTGASAIGTALEIGRIRAEHSQQAARIAELEAERADDEATREMMRDILTRTVNAIRGEPAPMSSWGWNDLPERAGAAMASLAGALKACEQLAAERAAGVAFIREVMEAWPHGGIDGFDLQDIAVKHGVLIGETRHAPCAAEGCECAGCVDPEEWAAGVECFQRAPWLAAPAATTPGD